MVRRHGAEGGVADVGEKIVIGDVAGSDQLDARLVEPALDELFHEDGAEARRHEHEHRVRLVVGHALEERREVRVLQRHADLLGDRAAALFEGVAEPFLGVDARSVVGDDGDDLLDPVLERPVRHRRRGLGQGERGAHDIGRLLGDHRRRRGRNDFRHLRLSRDRSRGERQRREAEAHQRPGVVVGDQFFGETLGDVGRAGVVLDLEHDLLAGDRVAMLLHEELGARFFLFSGRSRRAGHRKDQTDGHRVVVGERRGGSQDRAERGSDRPEFGGHRFSSLSVSSVARLRVLRATLTGPDGLRKGVIAHSTPCGKEFLSAGRDGPTPHPSSPGAPVRRSPAAIRPRPPTWRG